MPAVSRSWGSCKISCPVGGAPAENQACCQCGRGFADTGRRRTSRSFESRSDFTNLGGDGSYSAKCRNYGASGPSDDRRCNGRVEFLFKRRAQFEYQRRCAKRKDADGIVDEDEFLLPTSPATTVSTHEPDQAHTGLRGGPCSSWGEHDRLPREVRRIPGEPGDRFGLMDSRPRDGCFRSSGRAWRQGVPCAASSSVGTISNGQLLEDPPNNLFADRMAPIASGRPFAPLVPPAWSATALSYLKEVDLLSSKKQEIKNPKGGPPKAAPADPENPKPKGRPKFPKKPKGGAEES